MRPGTLTLTETDLPVLADALHNPVFFADTGEFTGTVSGVARGGPPGGAIGRRILLGRCDLGYITDAVRRWPGWGSATLANRLDRSMESPDGGRTRSWA